MTRRGVGAVVLALTALVAMTGGVLASTGSPVTITAHTAVDSAQNPFVTTGGALCDEGTVTDGKGTFTGWQSGSHLQVNVVKQFACSDGTFDISLHATLDFATCDTVGTWSVLGGTGAYARLHGAGTLTGASECDGVIIDSYVGSVHFD